MPSGHVAYHGAGILPHAVWVKSKIACWVLSVFSAGMMYVRMFLGVHYATDVLVGNVISLAGALGAFFLFEFIYRKGKISRKQEWIVFTAGVVLFLGTQMLLRAL